MHKTFSHNVKIYYEDTDSGGVVYYANYLKYFERARTEALSTIGLSNLKIKDEFKLQLGKNMPLRSLTVFRQETREAVRALVVMAADVHAEKIAEKLTCMPMTAQLNIADGRLLAKLGRRQGLSRNHLAVAEGQQTPWTILRVAEARDDSVVLTPLDMNRNIGDLAGAKVTFLEFN